MIDYQYKEILYSAKINLANKFYMIVLGWSFHGIWEVLDVMF